MCDLKQLATADLAASSSATILGAVGEHQNSKARKAANEEKARQATRKGEDEIRIAGIKTGRLFGAQRAAFAANGIDIAGSVTARDVLADTAEEGVREAVQIRKNAKTESRGYQAQADSESPFLSASGKLLGGAGLVAGKWYKYKESGTI